MWDLIVSVPDRCLSFYFPNKENIHKLFQISPCFCFFRFKRRWKTGGVILKCAKMH